MLKEKLNRYSMYFDTIILRYSKAKINNIEVFDYEEICLPEFCNSHCRYGYIVKTKQIF